jgi:hypothetical protein
MYKMSVLATLDYQWNLVSKSFECFVMIMSLYLLVGHLSLLITEHLDVSRCGFVSSHSYSKLGLLYKMSVFTTLDYQMESG